MFEVVKFNKRMGQLYGNVIYGKPDCWDVLSTHKELPKAEKAAKKAEKARKSGTGRIAIRLEDDPQPHHVVSDFYRIDPSRPEAKGL